MGDGVQTVARFLLTMQVLAACRSRCSRCRMGLALSTRYMTCRLCVPVS